LPRVTCSPAFTLGPLDCGRLRRNEEESEEEPSRFIAGFSARDRGRV